jgi:hypothetical protein
LLYLTNFHMMSSKTIAVCTTRLSLRKRRWKQSAIGVQTKSKAVYAMPTQNQTTLNARHISSSSELGPESPKSTAIDEEGSSSK